MQRNRWEWKIGRGAEKKKSEARETVEESVATLGVRICGKELEQLSAK